VDVSYYVFYARKDAEAWGANLHEAYEVRVVLKPAPFTWIGMREGILDERTYKVMPDHRFEVGKPNHAFLAPSSVSLDCAEKVFL
jgi:ketosteroid isomerase-like protein